MDIFNLPFDQISSAVTNFLNGPYAPIVLWIGFVIALLNCFFGYTLRKVWCTLIGILIGGAIGIGGSIYFHQSVQITLIAGAIGAFFGGTTAFALYRVGLFALCAGLTFFGLYTFFPSDSSQTLLFYGIAGIIVGILSNIYEHIVIILVTSFGGGIGSMQIFYFINGGTSSLVWIAGILVSLLGFIFQLKPWKSKGYWSERRMRDKNADEEYRSKRRKKRQNRTSITDCISSLFHRKKRKKKKTYTVYESEEQTPYPYTSYEEDDYSYDPDFDAGDESDHSFQTTDSEFDDSILDPCNYAMENQYSVNVDRSVFDKTQPDLTSTLNRHDATKTFSIHHQNDNDASYMQNTQPITEARNPSDNP